jgi:hypothetical protein
VTTTGKDGACLRRLLLWGRWFRSELSGARNRSTCVPRGVTNKPKSKTLL